MSTSQKTRILFVDDEPMILEVLQLTLALMRRDWDMVFVGSGEQALSRMAKEPFDVVVSDMRMPSMTGAQLLNEVLKRYPSTARIILSGYVDEDLVMKCVGCAHQFLTKPCELNVLRNTLDRLTSLRQRFQSPEIRLLLGERQTLPSLPAVYHQILEALQTPDCSVESIGEIVGRDVGLTAKLLQLVNSAFFGFAREVSDADEAVMLLGVGRIRSLALTVHVFSAFNTVHFPPGTVETIWDHSLRVGRLAERIAQMEGADPIFVEQAFTAGLLHDCGKLVLADMIDGRYAEVISRSVEEKRSMVDTEMEMLHASHADVGGYLLDLWGLPSALVESVAFHHDPGQSLHAGFNPLTVVYVANILDHLDSQLPTNQVLARFDMDYLRKVNVDQKIEHWVKQLAAS